MERGIRRRGKVGKGKEGSRMDSEEVWTSKDITCSRYDLRN